MRKKRKKTDSDSPEKTDPNEAKSNVSNLNSSSQHAWNVLLNKKPDPSKKPTQAQVRKWIERLKTKTEVKSKLKLSHTSRPFRRARSKKRQRDTISPLSPRPESEAGPQSVSWSVKEACRGSRRQPLPHTTKILTLPLFFTSLQHAGNEKTCQ